jgi:predicted O-methyltransferase YrrM
MDTAIRDLLTELEQYGRDNDAANEDRSKKMLNLEPDTAQLMSILIRSHQSTRILEIGTSNGYSTIWLAWAAQPSDGRVISIEISPDKQAMADDNLRRAGLRDRVDLKLGDATETIAALDGPFDFVFFDADRISAPQQLKLLLPKLSDGALVLADNALSHPDQIEGYLQLMESLSEFDHMVISVGKGLSLAFKVS